RPGSARAVQQNVIETVALDVQRGPRVSEVAEREAAHLAVPIDAAPGLPHETFAGDRLAHPGDVAVLPDIRQQALPHLISRVLFLFEQGDGVAFSGEEGRSETARR